LQLSVLKNALSLQMYHIFVEINFCRLLLTKKTAAQLKKIPAQEN
jgi:hypothetical protein